MKELSDNEILEIAKTFIELYWADKLNETQDSNLIPFLYDIRRAEPKKLIKHFKTVSDIFNKAVELCERSENETT